MSILLEQQLEATYKHAEWHKKLKIKPLKYWVVTFMAAEI